MDSEWKEILFSKYCPTCAYKKIAEEAWPCSECLDHACARNSGKPVRYVDENDDKAVEEPKLLEPIHKRITQNGVFRARDEGSVGYSTIDVSVPVPSGYIKPTGTLEITKNGIHDCTKYEKTNVNVQPILQNKTVKPTTSNQYITADAGYTLGGVSIEAVVPSDYYKPEESIDVIPTENSQTINPSDGKVFNLVTVDAIPNDYVGSRVIKTNGFNAEPSTEEQTIIKAKTFVIGDVKVNAVDPSDYYKEEESIVVNPTTREQTILPSENKVINEVKVNAVDPSDYYKSEESIEVKSTLSSQTITPTNNNVFNKVVVKPILLQEKTVTQNGEITADSGYDGLSKVNVNVESSTKPNGKYLCRVYDYDGTLIQPDQYLNEGETFTLPSLPTHSGLIAKGWCSPVTITNNKVTVENQDLVFSVIYQTESGQTEFDIELTKATGLTVTLRLNGTRDWGDGTSDTAASHTYANYGKYTIKCNGSTMSTTSSIGLFAQTSSTSNYFCRAVRLGSTITTINGYAFAYCESLEYITMPSNVTTIQAYAFQNCFALHAVSLSNKITTLNNNAFAYCQSLLNIVIPNTTTKLGANTFRSCTALTYLNLPKTITQMGTYTFADCYSLRKAVYPPNITGVYGYLFYNCTSLQEFILNNKVTTIAANALAYNISLRKLSFPSTMTRLDANSLVACSSIIEYDFTKHTKVPTLANVSAFLYINGICKIIVPDALYDTWIATTNWVSFADYIYKASEV